MTLLTGAPYTYSSPRNSCKGFQFFLVAVPTSASLKGTYLANQWQVVCLANNVT